MKSSNQKYDMVAAAHRRADSTETILYVIEGRFEWQISERKPMLRFSTRVGSVLEIRPNDGQEYFA